MTRSRDIYYFSNNTLFYKSKSSINNVFNFQLFLKRKTNASTFNLI